MLAVTHECMVDLFQQLICILEIYLLCRWLDLRSCSGVYTDSEILVQVGIFTMENLLCHFSKYYHFKWATKLTIYACCRCEAEGMSNGDILIPQIDKSYIETKLFSYQSLELKRTALLMRLKVQILVLMVSLTNILR